MPVDTDGRARRLVVGVAGARGADTAVRILQALRDLGVEAHLVIGDEARLELSGDVGALEDLAVAVHQPSNQAARISSGSFPVDGMIVAPCDPFVASAIAHGVGRDLVARAADVTIKEGRPLVLLIPDEELSPMALDNLRRLEAIRGVSIVRPIRSDVVEGHVDAREATVDMLLRAAGIERGE